MIAIVGAGPAAETVSAALGEATVETGLDAADRADLVVVVEQSGHTVFERVNEVTRASETPWFAVELGGLCGYPLVDAAVTGFAPGGPCYECLECRVRSNHDGETSRVPDETDAATATLAGAVAGYEATRLLDGADVLGRVVFLPYDERPLLPVPGCDCDSGRDRTLRRDHIDRSVEESLARAERALDDAVGIVQEVGEAESFPVPYYLAQVCDTAAFSDVTAARKAAGVDTDWNRAFMKALGEALERYCAGVYRESEFETGPPAEIAGAVDPSLFVTDDTPAGESIHWVPGEHLQTGEEVALPAEFVHYPPPERRYRPAITTGRGLGNSGIEAILSGLYEVIERDATMLSWYSTFDPMALTVEDSIIETLRSRARSEGLSVTLLVVTMDIDVPVVAAAVHREAWPKFALGTGANLDVTTAARSALSEALQNWMELRGMGRERAASASGAIGEYAEMPPRASEFLDADVSVSADTLGPAEMPSGETELETVLDRLDAVGLDAYAARATTRDVAQIGFESVRVVVPAAQPLCFGEMVFGERATTVPESLGFSSRLDRPHHPFP